MRSWILLLPVLALACGCSIDHSLHPGPANVSTSFAAPPRPRRRPTASWW